MVDASAYKTYVAIAFRNQSVDVTASVISFDAGGDVGSDGKLLFNGELILGDGPDLPAICNPRNNPSMLYRGAAVIVECDRVDGGGRMRHPRGLLYVLSEPNEPTPSDPQIKFELGCKLTLDGDDERAIASGEFDGVTGQNVTTTSKYEEAARNLQYWYQSNTGTMVVGTQRLDRQPSRTFYLGQDEVEYRTAGVSGEVPFDALKLTGTGQRQILNHSTSTTITTETGIAAMVNPAFGNSEIVTRRVTAVEEIGATTRLRTETIEMVGALAAPVSYKDSLAMVVAETSRTEHFYEASGERRLIRIKSERQGLLELALKEYFDNQFTENMKNAGLGREMIVSETSETFYEYAPDNTVKAMTTTTFKPLGAIVSDEGTLADGGSSDAIAYDKMVPAAWNRTEYTQLADGSWKRTSATRAPAVQVREIDLDSNPNVVYQGAQNRAEIKAQLVYSESQVEVSNAGQTSPPASERGAEEFRIEEFPIEVIIAISNSRGDYSGARNSGRARYREVNIPEAKNATDLVRMGQTQMARSLGRHRTVEFQLPFDDQILALTDPQPCWKFVYPDGSADVILVEGMQFSHDAESAVCAASGIRLAMQLPGSTALLPPYPEIAIEIESGTATEDGSIIDPIDEIVIFPPPIIHRTSVVGYGIGTNDEYTIKPYRPAYFSEAYYGQGFEQAEFTNYPEQTSSAGYAIGGALDLGEKTIGIRHSHAGYGLGKDVLKLPNLAPINSTQGNAIGRLSTTPIKSVRGLSQGFSATREARSPISSVRGYSEGFFVRPPTPRVLTVSVRSFSQGFVGTALSRDRRSSLEYEAQGKVTRVVVISRSQRGVGLGRMLRRHTVIRPVKGSALGKQSTR